MLITGKVIAPTTRGLPKTGQITSYHNYDDGQFEKGWWLGRLNVGNKVRFYEVEPVSGQVCVVDRATGLMWPKDWNSAATDNRDTKNWSDAISFCQELTYAGLYDWELPNVYEMLSLADISQISPCLPSGIFDNALAAANYWTSSTVANLTTTAYRVIYSAGFFFGSANKVTAGYYVVPVRMAV